ncbi:hypothetical protein J7J47_11775 [Halomonas sp. ISL-60]|nr:hypothetical protein [Halomonas sp. ISL-60]MBT2799948.1 hypothetical protein [Halomonas sp. ISL-56]
MNHAWAEVIQNSQTHSEHSERPVHSMERLLGSNRKA